MKDKMVWVFVAIIYLAILYTLVRPNSKGPVIVMTIANTLGDLVRGVTGETWNASANNGKGGWTLNG